MKNVFLLIILFCPLLGFSQDIVTIAGTGLRGYNGDNIPAILAQLSQPQNIIVDHFGDLLILDSNRVRKINTAGIITTVVGSGITGFSGDDSLATIAKLYGPAGIAADSAGNTYITEWGNDRIRKVNAAGIITTIAGNGTYGYNGDNIPANTAQINFPYGIVVDNAGNIYFSDEDNHRVRKIDLSGVITTIVGTGTGGCTGDNGMANSATLKDPCFLSISSVGDLYVAD